MATTVHPLIQIRSARERGHTQIGWLDSRHSFSFGRFCDPAKTNYRSLRVINDDRIAPGAGIGSHPHENMEILTWVLQGALRHGDSLENSHLLMPGELQAMSAGSGIIHSEYNASATEPSHFLQIWIQPAEQHTDPSYEQKAFDAQSRLNQWQVLASGDPHLVQAESALSIGQDVTLRVADIENGRDIELTVDGGRYAYVHLATGSIEVEGQVLQAGDAFTIEQAAQLNLVAKDSAQVLWFDLG